MALSLRPMTAAEFEEFRALSARDYASDLARAHDLAPEESREIAEKSLADYLPKGMATPDHHFRVVVDEAGGFVGTLWFNQRERQGEPRRRAFLLDIRLAPSMQGRGLGREAMLLLEAECRKLGLGMVALNVFSHNPRAQALYEKLGYRATSVGMSKRL